MAKIQSKVVNMKMKIEEESFPVYKVTLEKDIVVYSGDKELPVTEIHEYYCIVIPNNQLIITGTYENVISWDTLMVIKKLIDEGKLKLE